jgi:hypothetical protein
MPTIKVDLVKVDTIKDMLTLLMDLLNDDRLSDELREEYGKKFKELEI